MKVIGELNLFVEPFVVLSFTFSALLLDSFIIVRIKKDFSLLFISSQE